MISSLFLELIKIALVESLTHLLFADTIDDAGGTSWKTLRKNPRYPIISMRSSDRNGICTESCNRPLLGSSKLLLPIPKPSKYKRRRRRKSKSWWLQFPTAEDTRSASLIWFKDPLFWLKERIFLRNILSCSGVMSCAENITKNEWKTLYQIKIVWEQARSCSLWSCFPHLPHKLVPYL